MVHHHFFLQLRAYSLLSSPLSFLKILILSLSKFNSNPFNHFSIKKPQPQRATACGKLETIVIHFLPCHYYLKAFSIYFPVTLLEKGTPGNWQSCQRE